MWTVTRQLQWQDGNNVVEVSFGNLDYTNPDALSAKYPGEFKEFSDPREAVGAAIEIAKAWQADAPDKTIEIGYGATGGFTMPFDGEPLTENTFQELVDWANAKYEKLEKCDGCSEPLPEKRKRWTAEDWSGAEYCSEYCANKAAEFNQEQEAEQ